MLLNMNSTSLLVSRIFEQVESKFMSFNWEQIQINVHTNMEMKLCDGGRGRYLVVSSIRSSQEQHSFHHIGTHRSIFLKPIDGKWLDTSLGPKEDSKTYFYI